MKNRKLLILLLAVAGCLLLLLFAIPLLGRLVKMIHPLTEKQRGTETLEEAETTNGMYDEYILTEEDLEQINEAYLQRKLARRKEDGGDLSDEMIEQIKNSKYSKYALTVIEAMRRNTEENFYFGKYGDCFIFGIAPTAGWGGIHFPIYELGEYKISIHGNILVAHKDEWIYLSEAYDRGLLSDEDVAKLYEVYYKYFKGDKFETDN